MSKETDRESAADASSPLDTPSRRGNAVRAAIGLAVVGVLLLGQALFWRAGAQTNKVALSTAAKPVTVVAAHMADYRPTRRYVGTLRPWVEARIGPQLVSAFVSTVLVRPGALVHKGDVLATLNCREATATTRAISLQARAIEARQAALSRQAARIGNLLGDGFASANEVELHKAESDTEQARLLATRAQLLGSSLAVSDCVLRAPFDGEVAQRTIDPGAFVRPGSSLIELVDRSIVRVTADVPETDFSAVAPGTAVKLRVLADNFETTALIARRSPSADPATRTLHVELDLPNDQRTLPVNTTVELRIDVGQPEHALQLPLQAADISGTKASLFVVQGGTAHVKTLRVLGERGGEVFLEPRLSEGDEVVTEGRGAIKDGDRVSAHREARAPVPRAVGSDRG